MIVPMTSPAQVASCPASRNSSSVKEVPEMRMPTARAASGGSRKNAQSNRALTRYGERFLRPGAARRAGASGRKPAGDQEHGRADHLERLLDEVDEHVAEVAVAVRLGPQAERDLHEQRAADVQAA